MAMERHFIQEGVIRAGIESFLRNELNRAGYSGASIQKTPLATRIILYVEKPPLVIGKKGRRINKITKILKETYGVDNPTIDVQRIEKPTLDANIIARRIATALERGMNRRRIAYKAVKAVMSSGAKGVEIVLSGKIIGKGGRSRVEKYYEGYMRKVGDSAKLVRVGSTQAYLKAGIIGVTVKIVSPDVVFPDQLDVIQTPEIEVTKEVKPEEKIVEEKKEKKRSRKQKTEEKVSTEEKKQKRGRKKKTEEAESVKEIAQSGAAEITITDTQQTNK